MDVGDTVYSVRQHKGSWRLLAGRLVQLDDKDCGVLVYSTDSDAWGHRWVIDTVLSEWHDTIFDAVHKHEKVMLARHAHELAELRAVVPQEAKP